MIIGVKAARPLTEANACFQPEPRIESYVRNDILIETVLPLRAGNNPHIRQQRDLFPIHVLFLS